MGFFNLSNATIFVKGDWFLLHATKTLVALDKNSRKSCLQNPIFSSSENYLSRDSILDICYNWYYLCPKFMIQLKLTLNSLSIIF
jgi:hypothetical protein